MKQLLYLLLMALLPSVVFSQSAFHDAAVICRFVDNDTRTLRSDDSTRDVTFPLFTRYFKDTLTNYKSLIKASRDNPYILALLDTSGIVDQSEGMAFTQMLSAFGGMDVTTFADGLGKFLAQRTKEEINMAFFDKLRLLLGEYPELGKAFPATVKYLEVVMNHDYANLLPTLKEAFERDLKTLPKNLLSISTLTPDDCRCKGPRQVKCQQRIRIIRDLFKTEEGSVVTAALVVTDAILNHTSGPEIFEAVSQHDLIKDNPNNVSNMLRLLTLVSNSVRDTADADRWVSGAQAKRMLKDRIWLQLYAGLVYQQIKNEAIMLDGDSLWTKMQDVEPVVTGFGNYIYPVVSHGEAMADKLKSWQTKDTVTTTDVNAFIGDFRRFFQAATQYTLISPKIKEPGSKAKLVFYVTDQGLEITQNILVKNYSAAVVSSLFILDTLMATQAYSTRKGAIDINDEARIYGKTDTAMVTQIKRELMLNAQTLAEKRSAVKGSDRMDSARVAKAYESYQGKFLGPHDSLTVQAVNYYLTQQYLTKMAFKRNFVRYGAFMAGVILAKNSDEVKDAIQAVALPPGSASIKKTTNFSITLQAYTGFSGGREMPSLKTPASHGTFFNALSVYAPVGVAFNVGLKSHRNPSNKYNAGSLSAMFSIIDVGAIFSYRFSYPDDTLNNNIRIRLENIFAPGANIVYGIPKVPLSIGTGLQWQPSLTRVSANGATIVNQPGVRWQFFLVFDLPVLNLYTSKK